MFKVVCVRYAVHVHTLTIGKTYNVREAHDEQNYRVIDDRGNMQTFPARYFEKENV